MISLIICTRNRGVQLQACLEAVARLENPDDGCEVVVVDNGSTDNTSEVISRFVRASPVPVITIFQPVRGLARSRNAGIARARGDILAFTDDDCYVALDFLVRIREAFSTLGVDFLGGRVLLHDPTDDPVTTKKGAETVFREAFSFIESGFIHGANMAIRRDVARCIGGFDPLLGAGTWLSAGEDLDLLARASAGGWRGAYDPRPIVYHHHGRKAGVQVRALNRAYDYGRGACYFKCVCTRTLRREAVRRWYWSIRAELRAGGFGRSAREAVGACVYVLQRAISQQGIVALISERKRGARG